MGLVEQLIKRDADVNAADVAGVLPLHAAADRGHTQVVAMLLDKLADKDAPTEEKSGLCIWRRAAGT